MHAYRTHNCGQLRASDVGQRVKLSGWIHRKRDHGGVLFVDLRDHYGITQVVAKANSEPLKLLEHLRLESPAAVDAHPGGLDMTAVWAYEDEAAGRVRSRVFPVSLGIDEDEATGLAGVQLGALLERELVIRQGRGSLIHVRPLGDGVVEVGGRTVLDSRRPLPGTP